MSGEPASLYGYPANGKGGYRPVDPKHWGREHWSLLAYLVQRAIDHKSQVDWRNCRINENNQSGEQRGLDRGYIEQRWKPEFGTHLAGYNEASEADKPNFQLPEHDDLDCIEDFGCCDDFGYERLVPGEFTWLIGGLVPLTPEGRRIGMALLDFKARGGNFAEITCATVGFAPQPKKATA